MDETQKKTSNNLSEVYDWIQSILFALVFCVLLFVFVVRLVDVVGTSMVPTLQDSDKMVVSNLFYNPKQGDIIIFKKTEFKDEALVKRVIATEGQTIDIDFSQETADCLVVRMGVKLFRKFFTCVIF